MPNNSVKTAIILAGGKSSRMGVDKAFMELDGKTLLHRQIEKVVKLGVRDILISGPKSMRVPVWPVIPDVYPDCGPIGGIHACLSAASSEACLVLSVDTPLVPVEELEKLCNSHMEGFTLLCNKGKAEPLIGVYDSKIAPTLEKMIKEGQYSVRALSQYFSVQLVPYTGPEEYLCNCNTPEDFQRMLELLKKEENNV